MSYISAERNNDIIYVWERTDLGRELRQFAAPYYFFIKDPDNNTSDGYKSIFGDNLSRVVTNTYKEYQDAKKLCEKHNIKMFESDIPATLKLLSQKYYQSTAPNLNITFLDIEVDYNPDIGYANIDNPYAPINSISFYHKWKNIIVLCAVPPEKGWTRERLFEEMDNIEKFPKDIEIKVNICENEKELLLNILEEIEESDLIAGWNSDFFDTPYIAKRLERVLGKRYFRKLSFPRAKEPKYREVEMYGNINTTIDLYGRINADYLQLFKKYEMTERPSYKLESIANEMLPNLPKLEYEGSLARLYRSNFPWFCRYNIRDTEVLRGLEAKLGYVALANEMYHLSTGLWKHVSGTIKLTELAINNYCINELKCRVPDMKEAISGKIAGAFVLHPKTGLHKWIGSIDINSLYASAIRSINISPEKIIGQFKENEIACQEIANNSSTELTLYYDDNTTKTYTAHEWRNILLESKYTISGYGTVFNQDKKGIIPSLLETWYATRKVYQKQKKEFINKALEHIQDKELYDSYKQKASYYDHLQYAYKIKLSSVSGAMDNIHFRYYDLRMGESTTGTGRMILLHQCAKTNELLTGIYDDKGETVIYGDTDSTYFTTFAENKEEAILISDEIAKIVNNSFQEYMQKTFLCRPEFDNIIKTGREIVASSGMFVKKKKYALHVVDNEGETVDKMKFVGLDTIKTTIPPEIAKSLNEFIERLLRGEEWNNIATDIVNLKEWIKTTTDVMRIGLPKGVKNVEKYTTNFLNDNTTRLPGHVAASIFYNESLQKYKDHASLPITSGMKIKVFYLNQKYGRFHSIAIPTDIETVPKWFLKNFTIHRNKHIERLVDKPLGNIITAINKEVPSKQSLYIYELTGF
jgi:DNA polymerase elongation subunit (family B)